MSDSAKLLWNESMGPVQAAVHALNALVQNVSQRAVEQMAKLDGVDLKQYVYNMDTMQWQSRPLEMRTNDNPVGHPSS